MDSFDIACELFPTPLRRRIESFSGRKPEEIRLRLFRPPALLLKGREMELAGDKLSQNELIQVLERAYRGLTALGDGGHGQRLHKL